MLAIFLITVTLGCVVAACSSIEQPEAVADDLADKTILLKIAYDVAPTHSLHEAFCELAQWLETESTGRLEVELYPFFELGDDADMLAMVAEGTIQMTLPQSSSLAALVEANYPLPIPESWRIWDNLDGFYRYPDAESAIAAIDGSLGGQMIASLSDLAGQPFSCLGYVYEGPLCLAATTSMPSPSELSGHNVAVYGSPAWLTAYRSLGAQPLVLPLSEIYPALLREQVSVYQATPENIATMFLDDYSQQLWLTEHAYSFRPLLVNREWYQNLSAEDAYLLNTAVEHFFSQQRILAKERYSSSIETLQQRGLAIYLLTEEEKALWHN